MTHFLRRSFLETTNHTPIAQKYSKFDMHANLYRQMSTHAGAKLLSLGGLLLVLYVSRDFGVVKTPLEPLVHLLL